MASAIWINDMSILYNSVVAVPATLVGADNDYRAVERHIEGHPEIPPTLITIELLDDAHSVKHLKVER